MKISSAFPLVQESGARWSLRFPSLWMLAAAYQDRLELPQPFRYRDLAERHPMERELARAVVDDLALGRPDLVVVLRPGPDRWQYGARRLDYLEYFGADPRFAREFEAYGWLQDVGEYRVYKRMPPGLRHRPPPDVRAAGVEPALSAVRPGLYLAGLGLRQVTLGAGFLGCLLLGCLLERRRSVSATL